MMVSTSELAQLVRIIDGVFEGKPAPRAGGRFGQYLRRVSNSRFEVSHLLAREGLRTTKTGWINGAEVGPITLVPLAPLEGSVPNDLWGPVERLPALAEALGAVVDLALWTSAAAANRAHVLLETGLRPISLTGAYRWYAPSRVTPGEAKVNEAEMSVSWWNCRFLKATADDIARSPHALEYVLDYRLGKPGLKVFRSLTILARDGAFWVLPGFDAPARPIEFARPIDRRLMSLRESELALVFAYVEPWNREWVVIDVRPTDAGGCLAHLITWADFQAELGERDSLAATDVGILRGALVKDGLNPLPAHEIVSAVPPRALVRSSRSLVRWLRYRS